MRTLHLAIVLSALGLAAPHAAAQDAGAAGAAGAAGEIRVAVFPMTGYPGTPEHRSLSEAFRSMIITELGSAGTLRVIERVEIDQLLESQKIAVSGLVSDEQAVRIGRLLGAQYAVTGSIILAGGQARLDLRMIDIETSATVTKPFKEQVAQDQLLTLVNRVATDFTGSARVAPRVADVVVPPAAMLTYARGLDYETRGDRQQAAKMFRAVLEMFPQHPHARAALERVN